MAKVRRDEHGVGKEFILMHKRTWYKGTVGSLQRRNTLHVLLVLRSSRPPEMGASTITEYRQQPEGGHRIEKRWDRDEEGTVL